jgi:hypothetical protein
MKSALRWIPFCLAFFSPVLPLWAQEPAPTSVGSQINFVGVPTDWSHQHVIFSTSPDSETAADVQREPRYWLQAFRRQTIVDVSASQAADYTSELNHRQYALWEQEWRDWRDDGSGSSRDRRRKNRDRDEDKLERDWNEAMNTGFKSFSNVTYAAKYSFASANPMPSCTSDYVVFALGSSTSSSFNIIAFSNLYLNSSGGTAFCPGSSPKLLFAYYASTGATPGGLNPSPVLSLDGTQIGFIEAAGSGAIFHVLKWQAASSTPTFPATTATLNNCATNGTLPCEYSFGYAGTNTATRSTPFVDYSSDTAYASDNGGNLYAISPVFGGGTPATKSGWPAGGLNVGRRMESSTTSTRLELAA